MTYSRGQLKDWVIAFVLTWLVSAISCGNASSHGRPAAVTFAPYVDLTQSPVPDLAALRRS